MTMECLICNWRYEETTAHDGSEAIRFEDLPEQWICPECGAGKTDFFAVEGAAQ